jgi:hypothetical protein
VGESGDAPAPPSGNPGKAIQPIATDGRMAKNPAGVPGPAPLQLAYPKLQRLESKKTQAGRAESSAIRPH